MTTVSPGLTNDWPKWSPQPTSAGRQDLLLADVFVEADRHRQRAALRHRHGVDEVGQISTYPALYLWNQPSSEGNHTPSWDDFALPPIVIGFEAR